MDLKYEVVEGIAFTYANGVKCTLDYYDTQALLYEMEALEPDSKYVEIGSYLGCSGVIAGLTMKGNPQVYCHDMWMEDMTHSYQLMEVLPQKLKIIYMNFTTTLRKINLNALSFLYGAIVRTQSVFMMIIVLT